MRETGAREALQDRGLRSKPKRKVSVGAVSHVVVGILSCQKNARRRRTVESTWLPDVKATGATTLFLVGRPGQSPEIRDGVLYLDCDDSYAGLSDKVLSFLRYVQAHIPYDYVFKCDDDTFVDAERWARVSYAGSDFTAGTLIPYTSAYQTWVREKGLEWNATFDAFLSMVGSFPCGGDGYFLSRRAVDTVLATEQSSAMRVCGASEDILVTGLLKMAGIEPHIVTELANYVGDILGCYLIDRAARFATVHPVDPIQMWFLHRRRSALINAVYPVAQLGRYTRRQAARMKPKGWDQRPVGAAG